MNFIDKYISDIGKIELPRVRIHFPLGRIEIPQNVARRRQDLYQTDQIEGDEGDSGRR